MKFDLVVKQIRDYSHVFQGRVAGAARFKMLDENTVLETPCAFVVPLDDEPGESRARNDVRQPLTDSWAVIVAVDNTIDERGQSAMDLIKDTVRGQLWASLLGWQPDGLAEQSRYNGTNYQGGFLLGIDRARLWYQFEFGAAMEITPADGWQAGHLAVYPHLDNVNINAGLFDVTLPKEGVFE